MAKSPALSVRAKLTLSYAAVFLVASSAVMALLYVHNAWPIITSKGRQPPEAGDWAPPSLVQYVSVTWEEAPAIFFLYLGVLALGCLGSWFLAGRMLRPLEAIGNAARLAIAGSLSHRTHRSSPPSRSNRRRAFRIRIGRPFARC